MEKTAWTQKCEKTLEQHVWADTEWTKGTSWGQLLSQGYWSLAERGGSEELSRSRERWQSCDCTTRLWSPSVCSSRGASEQRLLDPTHGSILVLSYSCDHSWVALQKFIVEGQLRIWKPGMKPRSRRLRKTTQSDQSHRDTTWPSHSCWRRDPTDRLSRQGHAWRGK